MNEIGVVVVNTVCDNCPVNIKMLESLGAVLHGDDLNSSLKFKNVLGNPVQVMMDASHLIKLTRNTLGDFQTLLNGDGEKIQWKHLVSLHKLQEDEGLHAGNKLGKGHMEYYKNKMKVKFAAQTLSRSVSDALIFCSKDLNLLQFKGAEATAEFCFVFDLLFDLNNSKNCHQKFSKSPLNSYNQMDWEQQFRKSEQYILGLKHEDGKLVIKGRRSAAFIGWLINIQSLRVIFDELITSNQLKFILTYKLSQDPLEIFFSSIRSSLGFNNNPTCGQFTSGFKKLLAGAANKTNSANCLWDCDTSVLMLSADFKKTSVAVDKAYPPVDESDSEWIKLLVSLDQNSEYKDNVLTYISGYIQKRLIVNENCHLCLMHLENEKFLDTCKLIERKNRGGLTKANSNVIKVVETANQVIEL